jgi:RNA polymerase sigma-70 factor (ECF subfamily)
LRHRRAGAFQLQAAIAAAHARAVHAAETDWKHIEHLYALLETVQPTPVVTLNRSVAVAKVHGPAAALALIEPLGDRLARYFHFHGAKGAFLAQLGRADEARAAFNQAIALARTPAEAAHIRLQLDRLLDGLRTPTDDADAHD